MNTRYVIVDSHTGYVWGEGYADTPVAVCALVDRHVDPSEADRRTYFEVSQLNGADGYRVYDATGLAHPVTDGQDRQTIAAVEACPLVACVAIVYVTLS